ncbi:MAG: nucleoside triphosphate pyrophosphohydrolase [Butyricicoccaceae bacterium]
MDFEIKDHYHFEDLLRVMEILRSEQGCMWDRAQTHQSIRENFIEEVYEAAEAIDTGDADLLKEELGDVLFQVVFHAQIEREKGVFDMDDVADGICKKMIYRHPHVFGNTEVSSTGEVLANWDQLKSEEKHEATVTDQLERVAKTLPALVRAQKIQKKAGKVGFDWENVQDALTKVHEELDEVERAVEGDGDPIEELGDLLFATVNIARFIGANSEQALEKTCQKFIRRFAYIERSALAQGKKLEDMTLEQMDELYQEGKKHEKS